MAAKTNWKYTRAEPGKRRSGISPDSNGICARPCSAPEKSTGQGMPKNPGPTGTGLPKLML